jgi:peptidoglycan/LPS O-acetylase OafA/YrhL
MNTQSAFPSSRLLFLDWLRIAAFGLLVLYHVGMYYVSWGWHVKSPLAGPGLEPWMRLSSPWRLSLLFLLSGAATSLMLQRAGATGGLLGTRCRRLGLPLLLGVAVIVPPQSYFEVVQQHAYAGSYLEFLRLYFSGYGGFCARPGRCLILPTWNHLWFVAYLLVYTLVLWASLRVWPLWLDRASTHLARWLRGAWLWLAPIAVLAALRVMLLDRFPPSHALVDDAYQHACYFGLFVLGAAMARQPDLWERLMQARWPALGLALLAWLVMLAASMWRESALAWLWLPRTAFAAMQWSAIVAAIGFARRHLNRDCAARRYFTDAVFPVYILHQTVIIVLAMALARWHWRVGVEAPLLVLGTFAFSLLGFEIVRRVPLLRPWFGLASARSRAPSTALPPRVAAERSA